MLRGNKKFCPRCGVQNNSGDTYCIKCGYSFLRRGRGLSFKKIIFYIIIAFILWFLISTFLKWPLIPPKLTEIITNLTSSK